MGIFHDKVVDRIGKLDAEGLRRQYRALADEIGFFKSVFDSLDEGIVVLAYGANRQSGIKQCLGRGVTTT